MTRRGVVSCLFLGSLIAAGQDTWVQQSPATSPPARSVASMVYDALHAQMVLFGGATLTTVSFNDTWAWNGTNWTEFSPAARPPARAGNGLVYDGLHQQVVLFGGYSTSVSAYGDTWVWDGANWTQKTPAASPSARRFPSIAYDAARQQVVLFGGVSGGTCLADTWIWDGSTWTHKLPATSPAPSYCDNTMTYDTARQRVVLVVGEIGATPDQTWTWDGTNWTLQAPATGLPQRYNLPQLAYDGTRQKTVEFGGYNSFTQWLSDTWTWDGTTWAQLTPVTSPSPRGSSALAYDPIRQQVVLFGGLGQTDPDSAEMVYSDTWTLASNTVQTPVSIIVPAGVQFTFNSQTYTGPQIIRSLPGSYTLSTTSPQTTSLGTGAAFVSWSDAGAESHNVVVGAANVVITGVFSITSGTPSTWVQEMPAASPPARAFGAMAYDSVHQQSVLFGGATSVADRTYINDTWLWNGSAWTQATPAASPPARELAAMAYDALHGQAVLFGGVDDIGYRSDTWVWDGVNWTQKTPATVPPARGFLSLAYDEARQRVVLTAGSAYGSPFTDTWAWDGTNWTNVTPSITPPLNSYSAMAYDETRQNVVRYMTAYGAGAPGWVSETWTWNGTTWTLTSPTASPAARILDTSLAFMTAIQETILFSGSDSNSNTLSSDTWLFDGTNWNQLAPAVSPAARIGYAFDYDSAHHEAVLFGGQDSNNILLSDTWLISDLATKTAVSVTVPAGIQFTFNSVTYTGSQTINIAPGNYTLSTSSPQAAGVGTQAVFVSWSDGGAQSHTVVVGSSSIDLTGTFKTQYLLTTSVSPPGDGIVMPVSGYYDAGSMPGVSDTPASGYGFSGWSGACSGTGACSVLMNGPASVTATFKDLRQVVTILVPNGLQFSLDGIPYIGPQSLLLPPGSYVLSTPSPQPSGVGSQAVFVSWSDAGAQSHNLTVGSTSVSVTGTFKTQYQLTAAASPATAGSISPASGTFYDASTPVVVDANANAGYLFQYWSGACSGSNAFCLVIMTGPQSVTAAFSVPLKWVQLFPAAHPQARSGHSMAYDSTRNEMILFGGATSSSSLADTWSWDGANWSLRTQSGPTARFAAAMTFDERNQQIVLFGGQTSIFEGSSDTWVWNGTNWLQQLPVTRPSPRYGAAMAFDQGNNEVVLFGGTNASAGTSGTWIWDGTNWTLKTPPASPLPDLNFHAMAYDQARHRVVLFGGISGVGGSVADTWEWDGNNWTLQAPATRPSARSNAVMVFDPGLQQIVLFGGFDNLGNYLSDTWLWNGANWSQVFSVTSPQARQGATADYDVLHQEILLFGGETSTQEVGDTWVYLPPSINVVSKGISTAKDGSGNLLVTVTLNNSGNIPLNSISILTAKLGSSNTTGFTTPQLVTNVAPGANVSLTAQFPPSAGTGLTGSALSFTGSYSAGSVIGAQWTVSVRQSILP